VINKYRHLGALQNLLKHNTRIACFANSIPMHHRISDRAVARQRFDLLQVAIAEDGKFNSQR
jgi:hypothetical protein